MDVKVANSFPISNRTNVAKIVDDGLFAFWKIMTMYLWMIPVVFGIPGNIISVLVANRKHNRHLSPCIYITAMAVVDTLLLLQLGWFIPLMKMGLGDFITDRKDREYIFLFVWYDVFTFALMSGMFLVEMSIDRLIAVRFPMAAPRLCTTSRAKKAVIITAIIVTILNVHMFFAYVYLKDPISGTEVVIVSIPGYPILEILASGFQLTVGSVCPFFLIIVTNIAIIITLRQASKERAKMNQGQGQKKSSDAHLTRMLICVSVAYIVTSVPYRMFYVAMSVPALAEMYDLTDPYWNIRFNVLVMFWFILWLFNYSINFYLYCVGGGQKYRKDTAEICGQILACFRRNGADRNRL